MNAILASGGGTGGSFDLLSQLVSAEVSVTTTATLTLGKMHVCSGTTADYTVTLPAASGNAGKLIGVRMASGLTKLVTVAGAGAELIDGSNTRIMWAQETAVLLCDGNGWTKIAGKARPMFCRLGRTDLVAGDIPTTTNVMLPLNIVRDDPTGLMADTSSGIIRIRRPGIYTMAGAITFAATNGGDAHPASATMQARVHRNTALSADTLSAFGNAYSAPFYGQGYSGVSTQLTALDTVMLVAFQTSGASVNIYNGSGADLQDATWLSASESPSW